MPRKIPASAKQRKAKLQLKRSIKRGEASPEAATALSKKKSRRPRPNRSNNDNVIRDSARKLQSSFVKLSPEFLSVTKQLASSLALLRPIPIDRVVYLDSTSDNALSDTNDLNRTPDARSKSITVLKRPKWNYEMSKLMVEKNEEGVFRKWLEDTDKMLGVSSPPAGIQAGVEEIEVDSHVSQSQSDDMPHSAPIYERNLEVWRQLWRVTEISQILLILLDSRCPLLHYPPSLHNYLSTFRPPHKIIFVLTKVDITGSERVNLWKDYLTQRYPDVRIVQVESYAEKTIGAGQGQRKAFDPFIPSHSRRSLVDALKAAHAELLIPPADTKELKDWKPRVKENVDWNALLNVNGNVVYNSANRPSEDTQTSTGDTAGAEPEDSFFVTVGLIGQPNVGKSSLLNALFGTRRVKTSRTPGKTRHFQTLFWTPQIRLVDCPGLVFPPSPDTTNMEMQVLAGVFPIAHVPSTAACINHAARLLPLEQIFSLQHPSVVENEGNVEGDKRTWRDGKKSQREAKKITWTTMDILTAYATAKGWVTAMAGRPDVSRAGNAILMVLAEGRIKWAFFPPTADLSKTTIGHPDAYTGQGIWISSESSFDIHEDSEGDHDGDDEEGSENEDVTDSEVGTEEGSGNSVSEDEHNAEGEDESDSDGNEPGRNVARAPFKGGMFAALSLEDNNDDE